MHFNGNSSNGYNSGYSSLENEPDSYVEKEIDLLKIFNILLLHKWVLIGITFLFTILAVIFSLIQTPIYQSTGTLIVSESKNRYSYAGAGIENLLTSTYGIGVGSTIANELQIMKSRKLSYDLAERINEEEFDQYGRKFPILWRAYPEDSTTTSLDTVAMRYRELIRFSEPDPEADIVSISFESPLPTEASSIINMTMDTYSALSTEQNRTMAVSALEFLRTERAKLESELVSTEDSLQKFMNRTLLIAVDPQAEEIISTIASLEVEKQKLEVGLVAVKSGIAQYENQLNEIKPGLADQYSDAIGPVIERYQYALAELETNKLLYLTKNPDISESNPEIVRIENEIAKVKQQIKDRTNNLLSSGSDLYLSFMGSGDGTLTQRISEISQKLIELKVEQAQLETQETVISERYSEVNNRFEELPDEIIQLARLKRNVRVNEEMYLQVSAQFSEMSLWEKTQFGLGRPLDYAIPAKEPIKPKKKIIVVIGFMLGGIVAVGFILIRETINDTITSTDVLKDFGKPVLGAIPDFSIIGELDPNERQYIGEKSVSNQLITLFDHISPISEAYRRLRINVVYANPDKEYKILMVSSAAKGEGKSTVAANLAVTFTGSEKKVLIIDLDLRRPTQHKIFGENKEPGLSDALFDATKDVRLSTVAPNVDLITVGHKTPEPASVLDSKRLKQLIDKYKSEYDHIILDTAPYGIISDSASLLRLIDGLIVVSRFNITTKRELKFTLDGLEHLNADVLGIVLNAFNPKKSTDYYTNYNYYKRTYSEYYKYR
ncbi:MAG: polysaccharide biosynthesis tyrosine autokinase [Balneola sp.]|nr:polysaccharide biosynthesis tyrosine autokinase [Balneola sp.]MBO6649891.1 polysaccharide biosynthesis tyrosine autokinase [Balneola sp.]MBO6711762.1 polysaccharide biosynthesis tyrosine autokinase [Balneola sp.]MBO6799956.1 polysaccharide biosynthesis tyrosine autokinase [Balneola sp.]MBO6871201.1 polysaccharide biosynthesis tyrosine autokinase [Balneola sp.]